MTPKEYEGNCGKMQSKMVTIVEAMAEEMKKSASPIEHMVILKKFQDLMSDMVDKFNILSAVEFNTEMECTEEGHLIKRGMVIAPFTPAATYEYPDYITRMEEFVKKMKALCREEGDAKKIDSASKRVFSIKKAKE